MLTQDLKDTKPRAMLSGSASSGGKTCSEQALLLGSASTAKLEGVRRLPVKGRGPFNLHEGLINVLNSSNLHNVL